MNENKKYDHVEFLMENARAVSNMGKPESDNNYGRAASEILRMRVALEKIADTKTWTIDRRSIAQQALKGTTENDH